jgi:hypothetical protein
VPYNSRLIGGCTCGKLTGEDMPVAVPTGPDGLVAEDVKKEDKKNEIAMCRCVLRRSYARS